MLTRTVKQPDPITGTYAHILLHPTGIAIVDIADYEWLSKYRWKLKRSNYCSYAVRTVRRGANEHEIKMHREIARPAPGMQVHHENRNGLDNRRGNLAIIHPHDHQQIHIYRKK